MSELASVSQQPDDTITGGGGPDMPLLGRTDELPQNKSFTELLLELSERIVERTAHRLPAVMQQPARDNPALALTLISTITIFLALGALVLQYTAMWGHHHSISANLSPASQYLARSQ
jgi:hypothetical protein